MDKIFRVKYVDAEYSLLKKPLKPKLTKHEAYGYVEKNGNNIVVSFIKKIQKNKKEKTSTSEKIVEGLVIPDKSLISIIKKFKTDKLNGIKRLSNISVTWRDVIHIANKSIRECSIMYTEGVLYRIEKDYILLENPETIRMSPLPIKNHPLERTTFYIIPKTFITDIEVIEKNKNEKNTNRKRQR